MITKNPPIGARVRVQPPATGPQTGAGDTGIVVAVEHLPAGPMVTGGWSHGRVRLTVRLDESGAIIDREPHQVSAT